MLLALIAQLNAHPPTSLGRIGEAWQPWLRTAHLSRSYKNFSEQLEKYSELSQNFYRSSSTASPDELILTNQPIRLMSPDIAT